MPLGLCESVAALAPHFSAPEVIRIDVPVLPVFLHLRPLFLYQFLHPLEFLFGDDGLVPALHDDAVKLPVVLRPFLFEVVRHVFLPVFQFSAVEAVFQGMADGDVMPQALPHRREVAVFFKLLLDLLAAVARKVHLETLIKNKASD